MPTALGGINFKAADPLPGGAVWQKFNQLEMEIVTTFTYRPSLKIDACNFELSCCITDPDTQTNPYRTDYNNV